MAERLDFLTARPIAHRGLHDAGAGREENTLAAVEAALRRGFSVEIDLQPTADGKIVVFHDDTLDRLTEARGPVRTRTLAELGAVPFRRTADRIPSLDELLDLVAGRTALVIEIKGLFDRRHHDFVARIIAGLSAYRGPFALMSFDPFVMATVRAMAPDIVRGIVSYDYSDPEDIRALSWRRRIAFRHLLVAGQVRPHFISYGLDSLPALAPSIARHGFRLPLLTWTVRTAEQHARARLHADQITFEGFDPEA